MPKSKKANTKAAVRSSHQVREKSQKKEKKSKHHHDKQNKSAKPTAPTFKGLIDQGVQISPHNFEGSMPPPLDPAPESDEYVSATGLHPAFAYSPLDKNDVDHISTLRAKCSDMANAVEDMLPVSHFREQCISKLLEALWWARAGLTDPKHEERRSNQASLI